MPGDLLIETVRDPPPHHPDKHHHSREELLVSISFRTNRYPNPFFQFTKDSTTTLLSVILLFPVPKRWRTKETSFISTDPNGDCKPPGPIWCLSPDQTPDGGRKGWHRDTVWCFQERVYVNLYTRCSCFEGGLGRGGPWSLGKPMGRPDHRVFVRRKSLSWTPSPDVSGILPGSR